MDHDALATFVARTRAAFGASSGDRATAVRAGIEALVRTPRTAPWLRALHDEWPATRALHRDPTHGFVLLAHSEPTGLYRPPHDHGRCWVVYALQHGEMQIGTYRRVSDAQGRVQLVPGDVSLLRAGDVRVYRTGDVHDTRCVRGPSLLFRFTERDLKQEEHAGRLTRYVSRDGVWSAGPA